MASSPETLIVSPNPGLVNQVRQALSEERIPVTTARSAEEALVYLENSRCDLVFSEAKLPGLSGYELCRLLKDAAPLPKVILVYSAEDTRGPTRTREAGADGSMERPFLSIQFIELLETVMPPSYFAGERLSGGVPMEEIEDLDSLHIETASISLPRVSDNPSGATNTLELPHESIEPFDEDNPVSVPVTNTATVHGLQAPRRTSTLSTEAVHQAIDKRLEASLQEGGTLAKAIEERVQSAVLAAMPEFARAVARELKDGGGD